MMRERTGAPLLSLFFLAMVLLVVPGECSSTVPGENLNTPDNEAAPASWIQMTGAAEWTARNGHSSVVMPDGTLILMGGKDGNLINDVWRSSDSGATWTLVSAHAGWTGRQDPRCIVMPDGILILIGGNTARGNVNDVWQSSDQGATWSCINTDSGWEPREGFDTALLPDGSIILSGGTLAGGFSQFNDVWRSTDHGATWEVITPHAPWAARYGHRMNTMPDGSIILTGGYSYGNGYWNDVWQSVDNGVTWRLVNQSAGWSGRRLHSSEVMEDGSIVLIGGQDGDSRFCNDTWRSADNGITWTKMDLKPGWNARFTHSVNVMPDGNIVLMGGWDGGELGDVWLLAPDWPASDTPSGSISGSIRVTKQISPVTMKQGTDATVTVMVQNIGKEPVYDVEFLDEPRPEFRLLNGSTGSSVASLGPGETGILRYAVRATKTGSYSLNRAAVMYADKTGNYHMTYSPNVMVVVLEPLIKSQPQNGPDTVFGNLIEWINGRGQDINSAFR